MDVSPVTSHSSSVSGRARHHVFLSFRGADTRDNFATFLYGKLKDAQFEVYIDEEDLEKGKNINDELIEAINHSMISIPIISKDYASSESCLMELEHMLKCMDDKTHTIIPIFYFVDPSDVCDCSGSFATSLLGHNSSHIDSWKSALNRIGNMSGHHLCRETIVNRIKIIDRIARQVRQKMRLEDLIVPKQLVVVDHHVQSIMKMLKVDLRDGRAVSIDETLTKVLVISGITGVGKTVLAKYVYNELWHLYDYCSFCGQIQAEIERDKIVSVQNKLIAGLLKGNADKYDCSDSALILIQHRFRKMKVLLLLDDVKDHEQLSALVGELDWLCPGSRVIVTSQRRDVLDERNGTENFVLGTMQKAEALKLFCRHAFGTDSAIEKFKELSTKIVDATGQHPMLLELVGSSLSRFKEESEWNETLKALEVSNAGPQEKLKAALKKSYNNLDKNQQHIFLDIACFFTGEDMRIPYHMWVNCYFCPSDSIRALCAWSFLNIGEHRELCMHEILKNFGRETVKSEHTHKPWKRSRLCNHKEALHVLTEGKGTSQVEALGLKFGDALEGHDTFEYDKFKDLQNLRFLKLDRAGIRGNFQECFSSLRWLDWQGAPRIFDVQLQNLQELVILDLSGSQVHKDWKGWDLLKETRKLEVLKLTYCLQLIDTPKFPLSVELERLILEGCSNLAFIHPSSGNLEKLASLNVKQCSRLSKLPNLSFMTRLEELVIDGTSISQIDFLEGSMKMLETLSARDCKDLTKVSDSIGHVESLEYLALDGTKIETLQESIGSLEKLKTLSLKNCRSLFCLPDGIGKLRSLQFLDLSDTVIRDLPPSVKDWEAMKVLRMRGTFIEEFPEAILNLEKLEEIDFSLCRSLKGSIQDLDFRKLLSLTILKLSYTQIRCQRESFRWPPRLQEVEVDEGDILQRPPQSPSSSINVPLDSDLSTLDRHVMNEGVGENRRRDERERERERVGEREGNLEKKWGKRPRLQ